MTTAPVRTIAQVAPLPLRQRVRLWVESEPVLAYLFMTPGWLILLLFMSYPFFLGIWISLTDRTVGLPTGEFVGLQNYRDLLRDGVFRLTVLNTFIYGFVTVPFKLLLGLLLALLLNQAFRLRNVLRAALLLPWIVPTALSSLAWLMLYDPVLSPFSWLLKDLGLIDASISFLGSRGHAILSLCLANIWRGTPFFAVAILAGLQAVPQELHEAAAIEGANAVQRFFAVTLPVIRGIVVITTLFSIIWTFADFQLVYVLTKGGPANSTHIFGTFAWQEGIGGAGKLGMGAAVSLYMFPILAVLSAILLRHVRSQEA
ncbi:sugar ABC transporter permease [Thermomicrobiaceae bacterium CFH 74404]|uniref:Sugar ABC transporter permease n=1 Tax=Thermalbibacter longus TaxID=2951981 RepID=A0AA42BBE4_9BACT|nr:sugar ABC transporter permease [Thermalbibacter longus]MCM8747708.1 sugar ABC transporter permease [Thermalbibacter longus]